MIVIKDYIIFLCLCYFTIEKTRALALDTDKYLRRCLYTISLKYLLGKVSTT